jgi:hypothetical protein
MYPTYSLQIRHHLFSLAVAIATFVLYCFISSVSATLSGIEDTPGSVKEAMAESVTATLSAPNTDWQTVMNKADEFTKTLKKLWWKLLIALIILQLTYWGIMLYQAANGSGRNRANKSRPASAPDYRRKRRRM